MSKTIDERVVEMRFDNKQFEQNVQTSISSIEKLEKSLNLKGASKGLDDVNAAAKNCNMTPLSNAVETVKMRFSALEVMAVTALANITNSALNAGKNIVSALTIDPIKTGFQEYETQINAVQTILANTQSKGTTIDQVNAALDELNKYADQTIYNFTEMTRNIGTFTAAGVDLDKSVTSIKGIANLAAASGSNAYQASTAMYQLSQAIAAGKVSLQDWNSVVNAGMGGQLFQDALTRTAEHFGTNMDAMIEQYGSFRASLTEGGWLTTEVLTETLTQLSGAYSEADLIAQGYTEEQAKEITKLAQTALDAATKVKTFTQLWDTLKESVQSGWTQSWEIIIGDFEEAKELLTEVSNALGNMVNASAEARNKMLQDWKDLGGRTALIEAVRNAFEGVLSIIKPVKEAFREVFPPMTGEQLYNLTVGLQELTEKFKMGEETANNLKRTFKGVFALFDIGLQGVKALVGGFADLIGYVAPAGDGILGFTASVGDFIVGIDEAIKSSDAFNKAIEGIGNFLKPIADGIKTFVKTVADAFSEFANVDTSGLDNFADKVQTRFEPFVKLGELVKKAFEGIIGIVEKVAPVLSKLGSIVANAFGNLGEAILTAFDTASFDPILDLINTGLFSAILIGVKKFIDSLSEITENGGGILGSFKDILDGVKGSLEAWQSSLKAGTLLKIAGAMAILTAAIVALSLVDSEKLNASLGALSVLFVELLGSMAIFEKIMNGAAIKGMGQLTIAMIGMSTAVLILAGAVQKLSGLDWDELLKGLVGVAGLSAILVASATALSKTSKGLIKGSAGLVVFAAAIRVLVGAVEDLGALDVGSLAKGLIGVGVLCTELALFLKATDLDGMGVLKGTGLVLLAASINILADVGALAQIPGLEWLIGEGGNLLQGIGTAIGKFVGGIVGGFMSGVSSQFPQIGADLSAFMTNVQPFIEGATQLNPSMLDGVKALAETILILTAADILNGLTSWLTGGSSLSDFATQLVPFGEAMRDFSIAIAGMDGELVANAATAGRTLAEMAATLPNSGGVIGFFTGENDMSAFGAQLIPFGEAMMGFANAVRGLDADTVTNAATAGKAMAEMATTIPNSGGVVGFFAGENDMDAFGEQLVPFGEAMMLFSQAVKGLDANVIVESATAGKALIELANTVPNSGGVVGFFTGENDMDTFGEKLVPFGRAMKSYSDAIAGIDVEAVTNSATAGKAVVELANTLPNTGGLVSWFTGDNDIAAFGTSLVSFGKSFAQYSDYMKDVDANIVTTTTNAATSIVELQKSLPKEGGWFSDDMTLASFGSDMASFGSHFSNYYNSISGIDTTLLSGVITQTNRLVSMANGMVGLDTSGMTSFSSALTTLGETGVTGFINAFNNAESKVTAAASSMLSSFINGANAKKSELTTTFTTLVQAVLTAINGKQGEFQTSGSTLMVKFIAGVRSQDSPSRTTFTNIVSGCLTAIRNKYGEFTSTGTQTMVKLIAGIRSQDSSARMAFTTIISACLTVIKNKYAEFTSTGRECMVKFIAGVRSKDSELRTAFTTMLSGSITAIKDYYSQFKSAGSYLVDGFCDGISENTWKAEAKARAMAAAAAEAAEDELDEHSPSKRFYGIGNFAGVGFINALIDNVSKAGKAGREIARSSIDGLNDIISRIADYVDADMDVQPTIRPVLDLSAVEAGTGRLNALFSRNQALSVSTGMNDRVSEIEVQNGESSPTGNTYQFTQNNYSPKALSRIDIYRQTKNQFSAMKGLVGNT